MKCICIDQVRDGGSAVGLEHPLLAIIWGCPNTPLNRVLASPACPQQMISGPLKATTWNLVTLESVGYIFSRMVFTSIPSTEHESQARGPIPPNWWWPPGHCRIARKVRGRSARLLANHPDSNVGKCPFGDPPSITWVKTLGKTWDAVKGSRAEFWTDRLSLLRQTWDTISNPNVLESRNMHPLNQSRTSSSFSWCMSIMILQSPFWTLSTRQNHSEGTGQWLIFTPQRFSWPKNSVEWWDVVWDVSYGSFWQQSVHFFLKHLL